MLHFNISERFEINLNWTEDELFEFLSKSVIETAQLATWKFLFYAVKNFITAFENIEEVFQSLRKDRVKCALLIFLVVL